MILLALSGCAFHRADVSRVGSCNIEADGVLQKKAPKLIAQASAQPDLCHAISALSREEIAQDDTTSALNTAGIIADQRFMYVQSLVSDRHRQDVVSFSSLLMAYLTQADFECRHPIYASYFRKRFDGQLNYDHCLQSVPFFLFDTHVGGQLVTVDPRAVREIHLVFASEGKGVASSFGHVSVRFLVCPDVSSSLLDCRKNLLNHIFLGYVARIDGMEMDLLKGLVGGYDAHLFGSTFREVFRSNTVLADRDVYSLPLNLSENEIIQIVRDLSEIHWAYRGNYRFITANCATLLQDLLNQALGLEEEEETELDFLRPDSLFSALRDSKLARGDVFASLALAEQQGYFFPRNRIYYQQALDYLQSNIADYPFYSLDEYGQTRASARLIALLSDDAIYKAFQRNERLVEAQRLLEERWLMLLWFESFQQVVSIIVELNLIQLLEVKIAQMSDGEDKQLLLQCYMQPLRQISREVERFNGIPSVSQLPEYIFDKRRSCHSQEAQQRVFDVINSALVSDNPLIKKLKGLEHELAQALDNIETLERFF